MLAKPAFLPFFRLILVAVVAGGLARSLVIPSARANTPITVNNQLADAPDKTPGNGVCETDTGNGICTLRAAIMEANAMPGAHVSVGGSSQREQLIKAPIDPSQPEME